MVHPGVINQSISMDKKEARTAWIIAGILAVLLVIAVVFWMNAKKDLDTVLSEGKEDITVLRDRIAVDCKGTDQASKDRCSDNLDKLSNVLKEFSKDVEKAPEPDTTDGTAQPQ